MGEGPGVKEVDGRMENVPLASPRPKGTLLAIEEIISLVEIFRKMAVLETDSRAKDQAIAAMQAK